MSSMKELNDKATQETFNKKVVSITQHLQAYVKHRLYIAQSTGIIPKNMYTSNDFIDEAIAKYYESGYNIDAEPNEIKLKLFKIVDAELDELFTKESFHKSTMSTHAILMDELNALEEKYTIDEDFDFIMNDELNDISYKQESKQKHLFLYDNNNASVVDAFEIKDLSSTHNKKLLGKFYTWLPLGVSNIVDLSVFGRLTGDEIAKIKNIETKRVERILGIAVKSFKNYLD
ncbi:hypothetical protein GSB9_00993 [Flavobacteriaceae bacterium GSB9]|nr:hypothetical protein GSB9_00993 [Flavobacteriaceae bacterium GSB9]